MIHTATAVFVGVLSALLLQEALDYGRSTIRRYRHNKNIHSDPEFRFLLSKLKSPIK
jgi:hypothetical protein